MIFPDPCHARDTWKGSDHLQGDGLARLPEADCHISHRGLALGLVIAGILAKNLRDFSQSYTLSAMASLFGHWLGFGRARP